MIYLIFTPESQRVLYEIIPDLGMIKIPYLKENIYSLIKTPNFAFFSYM